MTTFQAYDLIAEIRFIGAMAGFAVACLLFRFICDLWGHFDRRR
jgi:hypothetical protein